MKYHNFVKGLLCGVLLVLICMGGMLFRYQLKIKRILENRNAVTQDNGTELELDGILVGSKVDEMKNTINEYYLNEIDSGQVEDLLYEGMVMGLDDPYSVYYTREELELMNEATSGTYVGIGVTLSQDAETKVITVVSCFKDSPAYVAGILPGDVVIALDDEKTEQMDLNTLVSKIKTGKKDSITLGLSRDGEELSLEVEKSDIKVPTVEGEMLEDQIGYLQILEFDQVTYDQFKGELQELEDQDMKALIIDLRNNPGGVLQTVCDMLDLILPEGRIVYTEDKNGKKEEYYSDEEHQFQKPMVVLINENSASASEIFAGAVKDYEWGTLIGTTTYGKGIVQRIFRLSDGTGLKLTVAKYYTAKGNDIHEKGIEPDIEVELDPDLQGKAVIAQEEDNQLQEAIQLLKAG